MLLNSQRVIRDLNARRQIMLQKTLGTMNIDAAKLLWVSTTTVYKMIHEGKIPIIRYYRKILIPRIALKKQFGEITNILDN